jgi:hypothetical protein
MDIYTPLLVPGQTRRANRWTRSCINQPRQDFGIMCTVKEVALGVKSIIFYADCPKAERAPSTFWEVLCKWQCTWMWENLQWVGDDVWAEAIAKESMIAVTDGSYMKDLYPNIHSAALVLECSKGCGRLWCSFPEVSQVACLWDLCIKLEE